MLHASKPRGEGLTSCSTLSPGGLTLGLAGTYPDPVRARREEDTAIRIEVGIEEEFGDPLHTETQA